MSAWQYLAAVEGYIAANSPQDDAKLGDKEVEELWEWVQGRGSGR